MKIARILSPVHSLGPGNRICIWTQGCSKQCRGCISPELRPFIGNDIEENLLANIITYIAHNNECDGITLSGGDPFEQPTSLLKLLKLVRNDFNDILVYTGFNLSDIENGALGSDAEMCLDFLDVLIDGQYIEELNFDNCVLRGSTNQEIHFFKPELVPIYNEYMSHGRIIEKFEHGQDIIITGIMNKENQKWETI